MVLGIQIVGVLFAIAIMYYTFIHYKRKELERTEFAFWMLLWGIFIYLALFPASLNYVKATLTLGRILDFYMIVGFLFLVALTLHNYMIVKVSKNKVEQLVRELAMKEEDPKRK